MAFAQPATFNEEWSDERVLSHLNHLPEDGENASFGILYTAYKHMRPSDFERFLPAFLAKGYDLHAVGKEGYRFKDILSQNPKQGQPFLAILEQLSA